MKIGISLFNIIKVLCMIDSVQVLWGKVEKKFWREGEIEIEIGNFVFKSILITVFILMNWKQKSFWNTLYLLYNGLATYLL